MRTVELTAAEAGQRLDRWLRKLLRDVPLGAIMKHLRNGAIRVDGKKQKPDLRLAEGMVVSFRLPDADLAGLTRAATPVVAVPATGAVGPVPRIVHRDDDLLVVDKPAGLAVQPGSGNEWSLCAWLDTQPFGVRAATFRPAPAHRLDRGTSGIVVVGLSPKGARGLAEAFREDQVDKVYVAVVEGVPEPRAGTIDAPLTVRTSGRAHQPKAVVDPAGKPARTDYEVQAARGGRALVRLTLHTGRTHQLRAHLSFRGHPIVGDRRYGARSDAARGFLLHAAELRLRHPVSGAELRFTSPVPPAFAAALGS